MITENQLQHLADLCRLDFSLEEKRDLQESLNEIVGYMEELKELDLDNVEPMMRVDESPRPFKSDEPGTGLSKDSVFKNAPSVNMGHFSIPKVVK